MCKLFIKLLTLSIRPLQNSRFMHPAHIMPCAQCLSSIDLMFRNYGLSPVILDEFVYDSLLLSMNHFILIEKDLSRKEKSRYHLKHMQAELLLSIIRRINPRD